MDNEIEKCYSLLLEQRNRYDSIRCEALRLLTDSIEMETDTKFAIEDDFWLRFLDSVGSASEYEAIYNEAVIEESPMVCFFSEERGCFLSGMIKSVVRDVSGSLTVIVLDSDGGEMQVELERILNIERVLEFVMSFGPQ